MKKKFMICCIIVIIIIMGIGMLLFNHKTEKKYSLNDEIKLHIKEKAKVEDLNIVLSSISDSTCPDDTQCIWQGEYSYELLEMLGGTDEKSIREWIVYWKSKLDYSEYLRTREDGVMLYKTYSDANLYIRKKGTEEVYSEAIDVESAPYEYEETDKKVDNENK